MLKLSPSLLLVALTLGSTDAFGVNRIPSLAKTTSAGPTGMDSSLFATVEKTSLVAPSDIPSDDVPSLFENYVMKTYGRYPLTIVKGEGCKLTDKDGKEYLDFVAGISTCILGHSNAELSKAVTDQINTVHHVSNLYYTPSQGQLASWLVENSCADKAFFCNSGAEANEAAIKCARKHANDRGITDPVIITAKQSFHGRTLATITATGQPKYQEGFTYGGEMVRGFQYVEYNNMEELQAMVDEMNVTPEEDAKAGRKRGVAAIMMEALQGEGGIITGDPDFFKLARKLCDENNALLICDEVQVGMGRSGKLWGFENIGVVPDVFTSAKALGGGVPIGAMMARGEAATVLGPGTHASTYGGNPLACAAALAVAQYMCDHDLLTNVNERSEQLSAGLAKLAEKYPKVLADSRGWGLLKGIKINDDAGVTAGELVGDAMDEGLLLVAAGPSVVRFVPPLIVNADEIDAALEIFERAIQKHV
jgi:acetylornithine/N-succinyldiaminopimelate aminotransferase